MKKPEAKNLVTYPFKEKSMDQVLTWKLGHKVPLMPHGHPCPQQLILLGDLVRYKIPLKIIMAVWCTFLHLSFPRKYLSGIILHADYEFEFLRA